MRGAFKWVMMILGLGTGLVMAATKEGTPPEHETPAPPRRGRSILRFLALQLLVFGVLGLGGIFVSVAGLAPVAASTGHWAITEWFLHFTMQRSVDTQSRGIEPPPLDDPRLVLRGAGHFRGGCQPCHGSPTQPLPRVPQAMLPPPPRLDESAHKFEPRELFYIVKHGVKFTGMPAWPAQTRDDEVWALVAFLMKLPGMDADEYRDLSDGGRGVASEAAPLGGLTANQPEIAATIDNCARCHGATGLGRGIGAFPILAGQSTAYLRASLLAYRNGTRHSGIMEPLATSLSDGQIDAIANYYAQLPWTVPEKTRAAMEEASIERGKGIANEGVPAQNIPACVSCHGPVDHAINANFPTIAGQYASYLEQQLEAFRKEGRGGSEYSHLMRQFASRLSSAQIRDVAAYYSTLAPPQRSGE